jgi:hypothetical protein
MKSTEPGPARRQSGLSITWVRWLKNRNIAALVAALLFPLIGIMVMWLAGEMASTTSDLVLLTLLLAPVAIYLIGTQRLQELSAGNISIKLSEQVQRTQAGGEMIPIPVEEIQQVEKRDVSELGDSLAGRDLTKTTVLIIKIRDGQGSYRVGALREYLRRMSPHRGFKLVALTDSFGRFDASITLRHFGIYWIPNWHDHLRNT